MRFLFIASLCLATFLLSACSWRESFVIKPENSSAALTSDQYIRQTGFATGIGSTVFVLIFPFSLNDEEDAIREAINSSPGCLALVDGSIKKTLFLIPPIFVAKSSVQGTCLMVREEVQPTVTRRNGNGLLVKKLGLEGSVVTRASTVSVGMSDPHGVFVTAIKPDSFAQNAGIKIGDIIFEADGYRIETLEDLKQYLGYIRGNQITLGVWRRGGAFRLVIPL